MARATSTRSFTTSMAPLSRTRGTRRRHTSARSAAPRSFSRTWTAGRPGGKPSPHTATRAPAHEREIGGAQVLLADLDGGEAGGQALAHHGDEVAAPSLRAVSDEAEA